MAGIISIYIMCGSREEGEKKRDFLRKIGLPDSRIHIGNNYYTFINFVMDDCPTDYALICHDDVILPKNILEKCACCVQKADAEFGSDNWAFIGNAGIDWINYRVMRFMMDPYEGPLPWTSSHPYLAVHLDGNVLLVQVRNCRSRGFAMPANLNAQHVYDLVLVIEAYLRGLACGIDSTLFAIHEDSGDKAAFEECAREPSFIKYLTDRFINHTFIAIKGLIQLDNSMQYLSRTGPDDRKGFYTDCIEPVLSSIYSHKERKKIYLVTLTDGQAANKIRRLLDSMRIAVAASAPVIDFAVIMVLNDGAGTKRESLDIIIEEYKDLTIQVTAAARRGVRGSELVTSFTTIIDDHADEQESYFWFISQDDFLMPSIFPYFHIILHHETVTAGDVQIFDEWWDESSRSVPYKVRCRHKVESRLYYTWLMGKQILPKSAMIYPVTVIKNFFMDNEGAAGYCDENFFMSIACKVAVDTVPLVVAGVCCDKKNGGGDDADAIQNRYHHATAISQYVNTGIMRKIDHDYLYDLHREMGTVRQSVPYRFMNSIMENKWIFSLYKIVKPLAWPVIRRFVERYNRE